MKKVLLVQLAESRPTGIWDVFSPGIMYISSSMKEAGIPVTILNLVLEEGNLEDLLRERIQQESIDIVALGGLVVNHRVLSVVVSLVKKINPEVVTFIGGGLVTYTPEEAMILCSDADYGVIGEGEITDVELVKAISGDCEVSQVAGIIYRKGKELIRTEERPPIADLDSLPFPDYEGFRYLEMLRKYSASSVITVGITGSRSCPFSCTFCSSSGGKTYRQRSLTSIFQEIDFTMERFGANHFSFTDELFAHDAKRVDEFCVGMKSRQVTWEVSLRIGKNITLDLLKKMKHSGCERIQYGVESADDDVLKSMRKQITVEEIHRVLLATYEADILVDCNFIFGDVRETLETIENTCDWAYEHAHLIPRSSFIPILLFPGSELYDNAVKEGKITNTAEFIRNDIPLVNVSTLTDEEYSHMVNVYLPAFSAKFKRKILDLSKAEVSLSIPDQKEESYLFKIRCQHCETELDYNVKADELNLWYSNCPHCNFNNHYPLNFQYFISFEAELTALISSPRTGIWGAGGIFFVFHQNNQYLQEKQVPVFDSNLEKQKSGVLNQIIYAPDKLKEMNIDTLVLTVDDHIATTLKSDIKKRFPSIKKIVWIYEINQMVIEERDSL